MDPQSPDPADGAASPGGERNRAAHDRPAVPGYHLLERIGRGTTGNVYRAVQLSLQREVALKVLAPELARTPGFTDRFVREARAAAAVHHPNVVTCYDVGENEGLLFQALELMAGGDLQRHLQERGGRLPYRDAVAVIMACASGLEGIHQAGMVHGDIAPANIFITDDGLVKLADLGLARSIAGGERGPWDPVAAAGNATAAPEQLVAGAQVDIRTDIYALGATLFLLVAGRPPFAARNRNELVRRIREGGVPDVCVIEPELPKALGAVIAKAMAREPAERYATPAQFREDLERLHLGFTPIHARPPESVQLDAADVGLGTTALRRRRPSPTPALAAAAAPHRWRVRAMLAGGILLMAAAGLWLWSRGNDAVPPAPTVPVVPAVPVATVAPAVPPQPSFPRPPWAAAHGEDALGRWAEIAVDGIVQRLRWCPPGRFTMGSPGDEPGRREDEVRVEVVITRGFWMADAEVGQPLWERVMGGNPSHAKGADLPVEMVSWQDCQQFLQHLGALLNGTPVRLPTEAEWEYACRAGGGQTGEGWFAPDAANRTQPRRTRRPNAWGLYDCGGNAMEWCQDLYGPYPAVTTADPVGWSGVQRVVRGGAWSTTPAEGRPAARAHYLPVMKHAFVGFRFVISG